MQAAVNMRYGSPDALEIKEVPTPKPKPDEVLVRIHATTVSRTDCGMHRAQPFVVQPFFVLFRPKRTMLGMDFAGEVVAVGAGITKFAVGGRLFGMSADTYGAHAELLFVPERGLIAAMEAGAFCAVIDRVYPLAEIVDAYRYVETGQKVGIVVISMTRGGAS